MAPELPFQDRQDFEDVDRGLIDKLDPAVITAADGHVVWDNDAYAFLEAECPPTAHPSLWRQGQLVSRQGLFEVVPGIYQVRGFDLSNMTVIEGDKGVIVIDPLISTECAAAALALYRKNRGDRPVTALIYTHSHGDHFGGARGVLTDEVPIVAPEGFLEHAVAENVYAGTAMSRRAVYMYGPLLEKGPAGPDRCRSGHDHVGWEHLARPADARHHPHRSRRSARRRAHPVPDDAGYGSAVGDELLLPRLPGAVHGRERHPQPAQPVDLARRGGARPASVVAVSRRGDRPLHRRTPMWPSPRITGRRGAASGSSPISQQQRDLYGYLHDQTLRLMNKGYTGIEAAEMIEMPPALDAAWHTHGYYGSVSHNVKAVYQRYMGWFDGNPANLWQHPPVERATRYVDSMGGADAVVDAGADLRRRR